MEQLSTQTQIDLLAAMLAIRAFENRISSVYPQQEMKTPVHLYTGQEACAAGVCANLEREDMIFSTHRNHGHYIAKGADLNAIAAELYGRTGGCTKGKGGSMHFVDTASGCMGTTAIVGGSIPLGAGAALALKMRKSSNISVSFFGDGAADEGVLQETLNFAALKKLPVLFVCENNFYATNSCVRARHAHGSIAARAQAFGIPAETADGNDAETVYRAARKAAAHIRAGNGPYFLELLTYRWKGHVGPDCDYEKGCRPKAELDEWMKRCPIELYAARLAARGVISQAGLDEMKKAAEARVDRAWSYALASPAPGPEDLLTDVYRAAGESA
ncbi:MAG: thiamine pyrophosphate-dependent dehydrogenase E1 component subunit alpha [Elusimicrobiaceae bacterium]|nr:thiamine pyrophosphate-dependent dehydrogenase E1 component subunit alpha [Elusimicrobiaceae bacterium]